MLEKVKLREVLKQIRGKITERGQKDKLLSERFFEWVQKEFPKAELLFIYRSFGTEADTHVLIERALKKYRVCVPQVAADFSMCPVDLNGTALKSLPNITIVPLLGFNDALHRIGFGKGCYDRWFFENPGQIKIGIAYDEQKCEFCPDSHDIPLDYIVTPTRIYSQNRCKN